MDCTVPGIKEGSQVRITETTHVKKLRLLHERYSKALTSQPHLIGAEDLNQIFGSIQSILGCHQELEGSLVNHIRVTRVERSCAKGGWRTDYEFGDAVSIMT